MKHRMTPSTSVAHHKLPAKMAAGMLAAALSPALTQAAETPTKLDTVKVEAEQQVRSSLKTDSSSIGKSKQKLRDIPQSVTVVNKQLLEDQGADSLKDALRNTPGLTFAAGEGGRTGDQIVIRGFGATTDLFVDGARDIGQYNRDLFNTDKVEILKGASSMLFGRGSTGGVVNMVSKKPFAGNQQELGLTVGTDRKLRTTADLNHAFSDDIAARVNVMADRNNSGRLANDNHSYGFAPAIAFGLAGPTTLTLAYQRLVGHNNTDYGVPYNRNTQRPLDAPYENYFGLKALDYEDTTTDTAAATLEHRFSDSARIKNQLRYARYQRDAAPTAPRVTLLPGEQVTGQTVIRRDLKQRNGTDETWSNQTDFSTELATGNIKHNLLAGLELTRERSYTDRHDGKKGFSAPSTTVGNPNPDDPYTKNWGKTGHRDFVANGAALYAQDFLELTPQWKVLLGGRFDHFEGNYRTRAYNLETGELSMLDRQNKPASFDTSRSDNVWSWRSGLIWQPNSQQSYYLSMGTSFNPSGEAYALDQASAKVAPEKNRNYELGAKIDLLDGDLSLRGALFRIEKTNERNLDPLNDSEITLSGKRHTNGIELEVAGRMTEFWEVFAGATYLDATIDKAGTKDGTQGKRPINTPRYTANLWNTFRISPEIMTGLGASWVGDRYATTANTNILPAYMVANAMAAYETRNYKVQLNLNNLLNKKYYEGQYGGHASYGNQRSADLNLSYKF